MEKYTVSELSERVKKSLNKEFKGELTVSGEITGLSISGKHTYFRLKDENAEANIVFWNSNLSNKNGENVEIYGKIDYYAKSNKINLVGKTIKTIGSGALHNKYEEIRRSYELKGYFENKKPLPSTINNIGIVTAKGGAALQDFLYVLSKNRFNGNIYIYNSIVQGGDCPKSVAMGIKYFNNPFTISDKPKIINHNSVNDILDNDIGDNDIGNNDIGDNESDNTSDDPFEVIGIDSSKKQKVKTTQISVEIDVIVITRGGGSFEDLMGFSDPIVLEAIYRSPRYTVSAVGHEIDTMLSDLVANHRSPTPSIASETVCRINQNIIEKVIRVDREMETIKHKLINILQRYKENIVNTKQTLENPQDTILTKLNKLDSIDKNMALMNNKLISRLKDIRHQLEANTNIPSPIIGLKEKWDQNTVDKKNLLIRKLNHFRERLNIMKTIITENNPKLILDQGFILLTDTDNLILNSIDSITNKQLKMYHRDGIFKVQINLIKN